MEGQELKRKQDLFSLFLAFFFLNSVSIEDGKDQGEHVCHGNFIKRALLRRKAQSVEDSRHKF